MQSQYNEGISESGNRNYRRCGVIEEGPDSKCEKTIWNLRLKQEDEKEIRFSNYDG